MIDYALARTLEDERVEVFVLYAEVAPADAIPVRGRPDLRPAAADRDLSTTTPRRNRRGIP